MTAFGLSLAGALALLGAPLFVVLFLVAALLYAAASPPIDLASNFVVMAELMEKPYLLPIPLFTLAGFLLAESQAPRRLVRVADALMGWLPGGLAIVAVATLAFFTTFTGASGVTIIALGGMLWPLLLARGYSERFSLGVITASGSIGLLFFPSLPVFLYATVVSLSTGGATSITPEALFLAGLIPGLLMVGLLALYAMHTGVRLKIPRHKTSAREVALALRGAFFEVTLPVWILLLLSTGTIGLLDIATVTVGYVFVVTAFVHRDLHVTRDIPRVIASAMALVGAIVVILAIILGLNNFLIDQEIPQRILAFLKTHIETKWGMLLALNVFLLVVGCLMDIFSALVAVLPLVIPLAEAYGIHPLHLGVVFLANLEVGYLTPPVGMNLFISSLHFGRPILQVARSVLPFMGLLVVALAILTYVEPLSTWLPGQLGADPTAASSGAAATPGGPAGATPGATPGAPADEGLDDDFTFEDDLDQYLDDDESDDESDEASDDDGSDEPPGAGEPADAPDDQAGESADASDDQAGESAEDPTGSTDAPAMAIDPPPTPSGAAGQPEPRAAPAPPAQ